MSDRHIIAVTLEAMAGDASTKHLFRAPSIGGGLTITGAYIIDGADSSASTAHSIILVNYGTSGTIAGSTIGTVGGTVDFFLDATPKATTLTAAQVFVDAGEWVVAQKDEENSSDFTGAATIVVECVDGVVIQG